MKLCAACGRKYPDETLNFCLDDGSELVYGPSEEPATLVREPEPERTTEETAILHVTTGNVVKDQATETRIGFSRSKAFIFGVAVVVLLIVVVIVYRYQLRSSEVTAASKIRSIAVLPLENLSGDPSQEYFADGMTDLLISDLGQIRSLEVRSRTSAMNYKGSRKPLPDIARELNVDAIVEGTVTRVGGRVRVTAYLIPANTDSPAWSQNYERETADLLKLQSDVAQAIAGEIKVKLTSAEQQRLTTVKTINPEASEEFLLGNYLAQKRTDADFEAAISHFNRAIEIDPNYAEAWAGLSSAWFERGVWGKYSHADVESFTRNSAQKALDLDPDLSAAHAAMCNLGANYDWDWPSVEFHAKRAIELDPSNADADVKYAWYLLNFGRFDEVKQVMSTAEQLDPISPTVQSDFGRMLYRMREFTDAETHLRKAIELDQSNPTPYGRLADVLLELGRYSDAIAALNDADARSDRPTLRARRAIILARMGKKDEALAVWNAMPKKNSVEEARLSTVFGDFDTAFAALNRALDQHETVIPQLRVEPAFDRLHSDPRWAKFLARMNLPPS